MKPTIGRIVIYNTTAQDRQNMREFYSKTSLSQNVPHQLPAVIVAVWSESLINAKVIMDGDGPDLWKTSINHVDEFNKEGFWNWPVIEPTITKPVDMGGQNNNEA